MRHLIDGRFVESHGRDAYAVNSAITGEQLAEAILGDEVDADRAVEAASRALPGWSATTLEERRHWLQELAGAYRARREEMVSALVEEFGTPAPTAAWLIDQACEWWADAQGLVRDETFAGRIGDAAVNYVPVGVAALITPWNGAPWFMAMKASVALAAGCTVVIKPSERGIWQAWPAVQAIADAGLPDGVINVVLGRGDPVGTALTGHPDVRKVSFTGSTATGKAIARSGIDTIKRVTLELGGKSPTILLEDADLAKAVPFAVQAGLLNNGQACIAGTRILAPESRIDEVRQALAEAVSALKVGDPNEPGTAIGPLLDRDHYEHVQGYIRTGIEEGAELLAGGEGRPDGLNGGNYVKPTLFAATNEMTIAREEIFGPVLSLIAYRDEADAIRIANDSPYGLESYVATGDVEHGRAVARRIHAGRVMINGFVLSRDAPFGGFKQSGIGREFGHSGIAAYLEPQAVFST